MLFNAFWSLKVMHENNIVHCDIHQGNIVAHGTPFEVMTPDVLKKVFQIDAQIVTELLTGCPVCLTYHLIAN